MPLEFTYTYCRPGQGLKRTGGFDFLSTSAPLAQLERQAIEAAARMLLVQEPPAAGRRDMVPVRLALLEAPSLGPVLVRSVPLGLDPVTGRPGNFFTHGFARLEPGFGPREAIALWNSAEWISAVGDEKLLGRLPAPGPRLWDAEAVQDPEWCADAAFLLTAAMAAQVKGRIQIAGPPALIAMLLEAVIEALPPSIAQGFRFSTFDEIPTSTVRVAGFFRHARDADLPTASYQLPSAAMNLWEGRERRTALPPTEYARLAIRLVAEDRRDDLRLLCESAADPAWASRVDALASTFAGLDSDSVPDAGQWSSIASTPLLLAAAARSRPALESLVAALFSGAPVSDPARPGLVPLLEACWTASPSVMNALVAERFVAEADSGTWEPIAAAFAAPEPLGNRLLRFTLDVARRRPDWLAAMPGRLRLLERWLALEGVAEGPLRALAERWLAAPGIRPADILSSALPAEYREFTARGLLASSEPAALGALLDNTMLALSLVSRDEDGSVTHRLIELCHGQGRCSERLPRLVAGLGVNVRGAAAGARERMASHLLRRHPEAECYPALLVEYEQRILVEIRRGSDAGKVLRESARKWLLAATPRVVVDSDTAERAGSLRSLWPEVLDHTEGSRLEAAFNLRRLMARREEPCTEGLIREFCSSIRSLRLADVRERSACLAEFIAGRPRAEELPQQLCELLHPDLFGTPDAILGLLIGNVLEGRSGPPDLRYVAILLWLASGATSSGGLRGRLETAANQDLARRCFCSLRPEAQDKVKQLLADALRKADNEVHRRLRAILVGGADAPKR